MKTEKHKVDVAVIGGGLTGICAALAAARHGVKVALIHDRPVLGGACSSEMRVHIGGADSQNPDMRETGILEELRLENLRRNPQSSYSLWDTILYEKVKMEPQLELFLNTTCFQARTKGRRIENVTGWQLTTETKHLVKAEVFIDCSGDGILAPLTGARFRWGREARSEFNESHAPEKADKKTMGMTCLFQARKTDSPQPFEPPAWAYDFPEEEDLPYGQAGHRYFQMGYWWLEMGGENDSIYDAERVRDELLKIVLGVWDHIKNHCVHREEAASWVLDWIQFLPCRRESRRYVTEYIMTQNDIEAGGQFEDTVAYGGWPMDDHHPGGFLHPEYKKQATTFYPTPCPYGISYRVFCPKDIDNLLCAGRCAGFTHMALSSARVMGSCATMGQAVGTASSLAVKEGYEKVLTVGQEKIKMLQQLLLRDDCFLPGIRQEFSDLTKNASLLASSGNPEVLRDGWSRPLSDSSHRWECQAGDQVTYLLEKLSLVNQVRIVFDSAFHRRITMSLHGNYGQLTYPPPELIRCFHLEVKKSGQWETVHRSQNNCQRLVIIPLGKEVEGVKLVVDGTWGNERTGLYAFYLE